MKKASFSTFIAIISIIFLFGSDSYGMEYVKVCKSHNNCKLFSRLIMGTDHLSQPGWVNKNQKSASDKKIQEVLDEAVKLGINIFDTSPIYVGNIEYKLGKWISSRKYQIKYDGYYYNKKFNPDRKLYTISKGGFPFDLFYSKKLSSGSHSYNLKEKLNEITGQNFVSLDEDKEFMLHNVPAGTYASRLFGSSEQILERVADELKHTSNNLNKDVTVYLMHRDDGDYVGFKEVARSKTPVKNIITALSAPELASQYWGIGLSNWNTSRVVRSVKLGQKFPKLQKPIFNSPYFSLFEMSSRTIHAGGIQVTHEEMIDPNFQKGIKLMSYSPLGGFSILDKPAPLWDNAKKDAKKKYDQGDAYWKNVYHSIFTVANEERFKRVQKFTRRFNKKHKTKYTLDQMINAYALAHKRTDFLTVGPITVEQLRRTVASLKLARMLKDSDLKYLYYGDRTK